METMTVNYDTKTKKVVCVPHTIHVPRFSREDVLLILHDNIVDKYDFAKEPKEAIHFENPGHAERFSQVRLNDKTLWLHDDNTEQHKKENAKFTITITKQATAKRKSKDMSLDPQIVNE